MPRLPESTKNKKVVTVFMGWRQGRHGLQPACFVLLRQIKMFCSVLLVPRPNQSRWGGYPTIAVVDCDCLSSSSQGCSSCRSPRLGLPWTGRGSSVSQVPDMSGPLTSTTASERFRCPPPSPSRVAANVLRIAAPFKLVPERVPGLPLIPFDSFWSYFN